MPRIFLFSPLILASACALLLLGGLQPASAAKTHRAPKQVRQQIDELEQQFRAATLTSDTTIMDRLLSDDYVGIAWTGQVNTKATQLDRIRKRVLIVTRMDISDTKVKLLGSVAIVTGTTTVEGTNDGSPMAGTFRYTRVYQRLPAGLWKITNSEATRVPKHLRDNAGPLPAGLPVMAPKRFATQPQA